MSQTRANENMITIAFTFRDLLTIASELKRVKEGYESDLEKYGEINGAARELIADIESIQTKISPFVKT